MINEPMTQEEMEAFLAEPRLAKVATLNRDGSPHVTPVWFEYVDGEFLTTVEAGTVKRFNLERDPRITLCVENDRPPYKAVVVQGIATLSIEGEKEVLLRQSIRYFGDEAGQAFFDSVKHGPGRLVRIKPVNIITWDRGKRPQAATTT
jgi:PPOX class probable F420-dependent enzyme